MTAVITVRPARQGIVGLRRRLAAVIEALDRRHAASPRGRALAALGQTSDGELAARGTTRMAEIARILGPRALI